MCNKWLDRQVALVKYFGMARTDEEIAEQTLDLARTFYSIMGYAVSVGYRFDRATHPQEQMCWQMARHAQEVLTATDVEGFDFDEVLA